MSATILRFPVERNLPEGVRLAVNASDKWDQAAEALKARDYNRFDQIMKKRGWADETDGDNS